MRNRRFPGKADSPAKRASGHDSSAAGNAAAFTPPAYGIDFVDSAAQAEPSANRTGMPDRLKAGIESLSGVDMSAVRVNFNSEQPARLDALAYTQGNDIHLAPGQEKHLPHEAWHVVQQRQGRVQPTMQTKGVQINDDHALEKEADAMGEKARTAPVEGRQQPVIAPPLEARENRLAGGAAIQRRKMEFEAIRDAAYKTVRAWVTPELSKFAKNSGLAYVARAVLKGVGATYDDEDVQAIVEFVNGYNEQIATIAPTEFISFIQSLGRYGGSAAYVQYLTSIQWPKNIAPAVVFGRAVTTAFYDASKHVVTLDPWKLNTWNECLDALTFECQNALQRPALKDAIRTGGGAAAVVEYQSDRMYVEALMRIHEVTDIDSLVAKLAIPKEYLVPADYSSSRVAKKVERPDRSQLPEQDKRQALWWWKTKAWTNEQRSEVWTLENHGEGVGSSVELYS